MDELTVLGAEHVRDERHVRDRRKIACDDERRTQRSDKTKPPGAARQDDPLRAEGLVRPLLQLDLN